MPDTHSTTPSSPTAPDAVDAYASTSAPARRRRWPLLVIGASAGTATWSGWVGLGELTGFGVVHPLPGIWDDLTLNSAITLPVGVEAYAVYALAVATDHRTRTTRVRRWAWVSAFGALLLGMAGQIAYHLLTPNARPGTPDWIVALVSCLPVLVLGAASLLWHLTGHDHDTLAPASGASTPSGSAGTPAPASVTVLPRPQDRPPVVSGRAALDASSGTATPGPVADRSEGGEDRGHRRPGRAPGPGADRDRRNASTRDRAEQAHGAGTAGPNPGAAAPVGVDQVGQDAQIVAAIVRGGNVPTVRQIKAAYRVGGSRAVRLRALALDALDGPQGDRGSTPAVAGVDPSPGAPAGSTTPAPSAPGADETDPTSPLDVDDVQDSPLQAEIEQFLQQIDRDRPDE